MRPTVRMPSPSRLTQPPVSNRARCGLWLNRLGTAAALAALSGCGAPENDALVDTNAVAAAPDSSGALQPDVPAAPAQSSSVETATNIAPPPALAPPALATDPAPVPGAPTDPAASSSVAATPSPSSPPPAVPPPAMPPPAMPPPMMTVAPAPELPTVDPSADAGAPTDPTTPADDASAPPSEEVPMTDYCAPVADWDPQWSQWEDEVLVLVNEYRALGFNCDTEGDFGPTTPLAMDPVLRCSARLHSLDMYERGYFDHTNPDGLDPFDRMAAAGFSGSYMGENIAQGQTSPEDVMAAWMDSDGHCSNIMSPNYTIIGVGYHPGADTNRGSKRFWTQNFGAPMVQRGGGRGN